LEKKLEKKMKIANSIKLLAIVVLGTTMMSAQATRTWVSGVGDDANPCSRTAPCKTWAGAISKTAPGGEIDALDPGGFGSVTITKAITLDGGGGQVASVLVSGTNGINVVAGSGDVVTIRNLRFDGLFGGTGTAGVNGIHFQSGKDLNVENCYIFGFSNNGIDIALNQATQASVHILNTILKNNAGVGIRATNAQTPAVQVGINETAVMIDTIGIEAAQHSRVVVNRSFVEHASQDGLKADDAATSDAQMTIDHTDASYNTNAITSATGANVSVSDSKLGFNTTCGLNANGGGLFSWQIGTVGGTNRQAGSPSCGTITPLPQI
jgi:hypothetical protein